MDEAVEPPWKHLVELPNQRRHLLLKDRSINTVFDAMGLLLILGEPGSGKTTTLLELASDLIARAKGDPKERVPIVLNLSSWNKEQPIADWIAAELSAKYQVPIKIARSWLQHDYLVPLLDGLDEIQASLRPDCVAAINAFIDKFEPSALVVCSRLMEYQWLPERLKLNGAICLESLSAEEVHEFLAAGGAQLAGLQQALSHDPVLQELSQTPLMLSIMSLAYEGAEGEELTRQAADSPKERREQIFHLYVERMFQRKELTTSPFAKDKIIGWLSWLAKKMKDHSESVFMMEGLQPSWLSSTGQRLAFGAVVALIGGLIIGLGGGVSFGLGSGLGILLGCRSASPLKNSVISGLIGGLIIGLGQVLINALSDGPNPKLIGGLEAAVIGGLIVGLSGGLGIGSLNEISLVETIRWQVDEFWDKWIIGSVIGLSVGLIGGLIIGLINTPRDGLSGGLGSGLAGGLGVGLIGGLIVGALRGLIAGMTYTVRVDKASPNQGIGLSLKNAVIALLIVGLGAGLIVFLGVALIGGLFGQPGAGLALGLIVGLGVAVIGGLIGALNRGGSAVVKHYSLRLILWINRSTPFKFIELLDHCAKLILLKKVGGGYMFIHRTLLEYFAELNPRPREIWMMQRRPLPKT